MATGITKMETLSVPAGAETATPRKAGADTVSRLTNMTCGSALNVGKTGIVAGRSEADKPSLPFLGRVENPLPEASGDGEGHHDDHP